MNGNRKRVNIHHSVTIGGESNQRKDQLVEAGSRIASGEWRVGHIE